MNPRRRLFRWASWFAVANAALLGVIGLRYDATEVMQGVTEVLCYGTAVIVARE